MRKGKFTDEEKKRIKHALKNDEDNKKAKELCTVQGSKNSVQQDALHETEEGKRARAFSYEEDLLILDRRSLVQRRLLSISRTGWKN